MSLFDADDAIDRSDAGPAAYSEPHFSYLNRSGRQDVAIIRKLLEEWFAKYPTAHQPELRARFRSSDAVPHQTAFFELYLHELLTLLGYKLQVHPRVPGSDKRPDFFAERNGEPRFYLEAIVATNRSTNAHATQLRLNRVYDALNGVESPNFFIGIDVFGTPSTPVPERRLRQVVAQFLDGLDPESLAAVVQVAGLDGLPRGRFEHEGMRIEFFPIPKSPASRGKPGIRPLGMHGPGEASWVDDVSALRSAVARKATKYGELNRPYVIAVNAIDQHLDEIDIMEALFGSETFVFRTNDGSEPLAEPEMIRKPDGVWRGPKGSNTRVSAVAVASSLLPWTVHVSTPAVYHNPWARFPSLNALKELPHAVPVENRLVTVPGDSFAVLAGLPAEWPGPKKNGPLPMAQG